MNKCDKCGFMHYRTDPCRAKESPKASLPPRADPPRSGVAPRKDVTATPSGAKFDKVAYQRQYMRDRRARLKAKKEGK